MPRWDTFMLFLHEAQQTPPEERQALVNALLAERRDFPWIEDRKATFVYVGNSPKSVALNLDIIQNDPPFEQLVRLTGTNFWYLQRVFARDDLLDYMLAVDDPMTPLAQEQNLVQRIEKHWQIDQRNPKQLETAQVGVSILQMPQARPYPDWQAMSNVTRGSIYEHDFDSAQMGFTGRKVWVYTPPEYDPDDGIMYPLMVLLDGQWMIGPLQVPYIADALIKHGRMQPVIIAMIQSGTQAERIRDFVSNDAHYSAVLTELLPFLQTEYQIDSTNLGIGGVGVGAIAAAHASLKNPAVFAHLLMLSPPLGRGPAQDKLVEYAERFRDADLLPKRIFQSVGRYEMRTRFYEPGLALSAILKRRAFNDSSLNYRFVELGSAHSLAAFKSIMPEALSHIFPGEAVVQRRS